ncbi:hypothetical protein SABVI_1692 [Streptococcus anginosus]|uniref:Uncharacterized protein n=1 Tax=Streptococcus anginosus TaxID=1328 RepID=A0AAW5TI61_STRAP|nr:hypothetical protein [Streptococcus anginosus]KAA9323582.1 hypothetical protein F6H95_04900 [Streptococcus anginosus]MCW1009955.1 hypothetical protein [Streptococcus anginosus]MCW1037424.1 hypothetical protein [Streptococcus anginosus]MCW1053918.1 hypothetical protein [Streptococcus anginosus]MCW1055620.1 hypothetical protein [Streptococcus anginosus]
MDMKAFQAKDEIIVSEAVQSKITANALFNFMREYSFLEKVIFNMAISPRYYPEDISYLNLRYNDKDLPALPLSIIETSILEDEQGQEFWTKDLFINVLEIRLKDNYNIRFIQEKLDLYIIIEDLEAFRLGCSQLVEDLVNPNKKYLVYRDFIRAYRNMLPHEKIEFHQKKIREEIARKNSSKK